MKKYGRLWSRLILGRPYEASDEFIVTMITMFVALISMLGLGVLCWDRAL